MGIGLGFPCCVCVPSPVECEMDRPFIELEGSSRIGIGSSPLSNTFVIVRTSRDESGSFPCPEASFFSSSNYHQPTEEVIANNNVFVLGYDTEDSEWWYFTREPQNDGINLVLAVSKSGAVDGVVHATAKRANQVKLLMYDSDQYLSLVPKPGDQSKLVPTTEPELESESATSGPRSRCSCPLDFRLDLLPFVAARRWRVPSKAGLTGFSSFDTTEVESEPTNFQATWSGFGGSGDCNNLNRSSSVASASADVIFQQLLDGYAYAGSMSWSSVWGWSWQVWPVRLGHWTADLFFTAVSNVAAIGIEKETAFSSLVLSHDFTARDPDSSTWGNFSEFAVTGNCATLGNLTALEV